MIHLQSYNRIYLDGISLLNCKIIKKMEYNLIIMTFNLQQQITKILYFKIIQSWEIIKIKNQTMQTNIYYNKIN